MAMTVSYSVVPRKNPAKKSEPAKYYAQAQASGELDFEELCEAITSRSTCTETDVRAAISGILYEVKRALKAGRIARLGDLGSLQIGLNSEGGYGQKTFESLDTDLPRFMSEFGFQSFPEMKTIATFAAPEDYQIESEVMNAQ